MTIGKQMFKVRTEMGKTQEQMAKIMNIRTIQYNRYETGKSSPTYEGMKTFATKFRTTLHIYPE